MILVKNPAAAHDYTIDRTFRAGLILTGPEVKSLRLKQASLKGSYIKIVTGEAFLLNAQITPYQFADNRQYDPKRTRKLLLNSQEIYQLMEISQKKGWSIFPLTIETINNRLKLNLGVGRGKREYEKRAALKKKAIERDVSRELKQKIRLG